VNELKKQGWLPDKKEKHLLIDSLLKFFSVASADEWKKIYIDNEISVSFKISLAKTQSPHAISAWLRIGEIQSMRIEIPAFDKKKFKDALSEIKLLATKKAVNHQLKLQEICAQSGIAVVFTNSLPKAPISGATRWFHNKPIIQLNSKFKSNNHFWFTFFHEAAHILLHGKKEIFLENVDGTVMDQEKEEEANAFARKYIESCGD
jgi:hypothetical protein